MCNRKRIIALFLSLLMIFSAFPITDISVFAEESEEDSIQSILDEREEKTAGLLELAEKARDDAAELVSDPFGSYSSPVSFFSLRSPAESVSEELDFGWEYDEETKTLTVSGSGAMPDYSDIESDEPIPVINTPWYEYATEIEKIVVEEGITSVGDFAFAFCLNAKEVILPEGITTIGIGAFAYCFSLKELNLPSTLRTVGEAAFIACWSVESLELPDGLEEIGNDAFAYMMSVESLNIPENIQYIGDYAFIYMTNLKEITVPAGVSDFEYSLYENFDSVFAIEKVANNSLSAVFSDCVFYSFDSIEWAEIYSVFVACMLKYQIGSSVVNSFTEADVIVETVDFINSKIGTNYNAADFDSMEDFECMLDIIGYHSLAIPNSSYFSVECLYESAQHDYCSENKIMHKIIGEDDFCDCYVKDGTIGDNITWSIDTETKTLTIDGAGELYIDELPEYSYYSGFINNVEFAADSEITAIDGAVFYGLTGVSEVTIPEGVRYLGDVCFYGSEISVINLPASLSEIEVDTFHNFTAEIEEINVAEGNPNFISVDGSLYMNYEEFNNEMTYILIKQPEKNANEFLANTFIINPLAFENYKNVTEINIPESVLYIGEAAFFCCMSLETVNIQGGIIELDGETGSIEIDERCFAYCYNLKEINVDEDNCNYTSVDGVLYNKDVTELVIGPAGKKEIILPATVNYVSRHNGLDGAMLRKVTFLNPECEIFDDSASISDNATIYGYTGSTAEEYAEKYNREFVSLDGDIPENPDDDETDILDFLTYEIIDGEVTITDCDESISGDVVIPGTIEGYPVTTIGDYAFSDCYSLASIEIPDSVTTIGNYAFCGCDSLASIEIPDSVTTIGEGAFANCDNLASIEIPDSVTTIGEGAFADCHSLEQIIVDEDNEYYSSDEYGVLFNKTKTLLVQYPAGNRRTSYTIPDGVTTIGVCAFIHTVFVENISLPETLNCIEESAFGECFALESINIPSGVTEIATGAFAICFSLESVILPDGITSIGNYAFEACINLRSVNIPETVTSIGSSAFESCFCLEKITLPESVETVGEYAFEYCISLKDIYVYNPDAVLETGCIPDITIRLPGMTIQEYARAYADGHIELYQAYASGASDEELREIQLKYEHIFISEELSEEIKSDVVIHGYAESTAHAYAEEYELFFAYFGDSCEHLNVEFRNPVNATCLSEGFTGNLVCAECDEMLAYGRTIPATGFHAVGEWEVTSVPTCTQPGMKIRECADCGESEESEIEATGHTDADSDEICDICGEATCYTINVNETITVYVPQYGRTLVKFVPATTGTYIFSSSSSSEYLDTYGYLYDAEMNLIDSDDDGNDSGHFLIECTLTAGETYYFGCGFYDDYNSGSYQVTLSAWHEHNYISTVTPPTCTEGGYTTYSCSECGYTYTDDYVNPCHTFSTENEFCTVCGENAIEGLIEYSIENGEVTITDCYSYVVSVVIPETIEGYPVTTIGNYAFNDCYNLESVIIPDSITTIGDYAFYCCYSLASIEIPDSVTTIGDRAFRYCYNLTEIIVDENNDNYSSDEYGVLYNKTKTLLIQYPAGNSRTSYTIPDSVTTIGYYAFEDCDSLESIEIPDSVTTIGDMAFYSCDSLASIKIPDGITTIGYYTFACCYSLTSIEISDGVTTIGEGAFSDCDNLVSIEIPDSITTIGYEAFYSCDSLESIEISDSVTTIGGYVFFDCDSLESIEIPGSVTTIGDSVFYDCDSLASIEIPESVTTIGYDAFNSCDSLEQIIVDENNEYYSSDEYGVLFNKTKTLLIQYPAGNSRTSYTIHDSVTTIGDGAFRACSSLASIEIPGSVTTIGYDAFYDCDSLASIEIPESVTTIGYVAFEYCYSLERITINNPECEIYDSQYTIYYDAVIYGIPGSTAHAYAEKYDRAFESICENHDPDAVVTPPTCTQAGYTTYSCSECGYSYNGDFVPATGHTDNDDDGICDVCGYHMYYTINANETITVDVVGNQVTLIKFVPDETALYKFFSSADKDTYGYIYDAEMNVLDSDDDDGDDNNFFIEYELTAGETYYFGCRYYSSSNSGSYDVRLEKTHVHDYYASEVKAPTCVEAGYTVYICTICGDSYEDDYIEAPGHAFSTENEFCTVCGENVIEGLIEYSIENGEVTITDCYSYVVSVVIPETIEGYPVIMIGDYAFYENYNLKNIVIPNSVTTIGCEAFYNCSNLENIELPDSVITIGDYAFVNCDKFTSIEISEGVTTIGEFAFQICSRLAEIIVDENNDNYSSDEYGVLYNKTKTLLIQYPIGNSRTSYIIPDGVTIIDDYAFGFCDSLESVEISDSVTTIGEYAFSGCEYLEGIEIPEGVITIGNGAFGYCDSFESITINNPECVIYDSSSTIHNGAVIYGLPGSTAEAYAEKYDRAFESICENHAPDAVVTPPTCTEAGYTTYSCSECGHTYTDDYVAALGHTVTENEFCTVCGENAIEGLIEYSIENNEVTIIDCYSYVVSVVIPETIEGYPITKIGNYAFSNCDSLESIEIPDSVTIIDYGAFYSCDSLASIEISDSVTTIGEYVFYDCDSLENIEIPDSVTTIGNYAFCYCDSLERIEIPDSVTTIGGCAFRSCYNLAEIIVDENNDNYSSDEYGVLFNKTKTLLIQYPADNSRTSYSIPGSVTTIDAYAFSNCDNLASIEIPGSVTTIGYEAFYGCDSLESIIINNPECEIYDSSYTIYYGTVIYGIPGSTAEAYAEEYDRVFRPICENHNPDAVVIPPTCTQAGYTTYSCSECGYSYNGDFVPATGHTDSNDDGICETCGYHMYYTINAGETITVDVVGQQVTLVKFVPEESGYYRFRSITDSDAYGYLYDADMNFLESDDDSGNDWNFRIDYWLNAGETYYFGCRYYSSSDSGSYKVRLEYYGQEDFTDDEPETEEETTEDSCDHYYDYDITPPTCTDYGYTRYTCEYCGYSYTTDYVDPTGHEYETEEVFEADCTQWGYTVYTCVICGYSYEGDIVEPLGHDGIVQETVAPTCTGVGYTEYVCDRCGIEYRADYIDVLGHDFGEWVEIVPATVVQPGKRQRTCINCGYIQTETTPRLEIDWEGNENYGLVNFTVVDAQTLEPLSDAWISVLTEEGETSTYGTDSEGRVSIVLPVGEVRFTAGGPGKITRNLRYVVEHREFDAPLIGLSGDSLIDADITVKEMTLDEIIDAGIDIESPENKHIVEYTITFVFEGEERTVKYYEDDDNNRYYPSGGSSGVGGYYPDTPDGGYIFDDKTVYVTEKFYLVVHGQISWLKQMFNVEMNVYNNSRVDTFENVEATIILPEGLSLADMVEGEQSLTQNLGTVAENSSVVCNWYIRGDEAGVYSLSANLSGVLMPFSEEFSYTYEAESPIKVYDENAIRLYAEIPERVECGKNYDVTIGIENISDITLYNVSHLIKDMGQCVVRHYLADGTVVKEVYANETINTSAFVSEFRPGDKLELTINAQILFESEVYKDCIFNLVEVLIDAENVKTDIENGFGVPESHSYGEFTETKTPTCTQTGEEVSVCENCGSEIKNILPARGHDYEAVVTQPGCTTQGCTTYTCRVCGDRYVDDYVAPLGHDGVVKEVTPPTCLTVGFTTYVCNRCGYDYNENYVPALGHDFSEEWTIDTPATCNQTGSKSHHCSRCDEKSDITEIPMAEHTLQPVEIPSTCTVAGVRYDICLVCQNMFNYAVLPLASHTWSEWSTETAATCTQTGLETRMCAVCKKIEENVLPALGHDFSEEWTIDTPATCTQTGSQSYHCTRCTAKKDITAIPAKGHTWSEWSIETAATCTQTGLETRMCAVCKKIEENVLPALGHEFSEEWTIDTPATCETAGSQSHHCVRCEAKTGITAIPAKGHTWSEWSTETAATCTQTGLETRMCAVCKKTEENVLPALGHDFSEEWTIDVPATCETAGSKSHHCSRCDEKSDVTVIPALDHTWSAWITVIAPDCITGGIETRACSFCGAEEENILPALGHDFSEEWIIDIPATCETAGSQSHHCSRCDERADVSEIPAKGHTWSDWITVTEPDCVTEGLEKRTCSVCVVEEENKISALGHDFSEEWTIDTPATCDKTGSKSRHCSRCDEKTDVTEIEKEKHLLQHVEIPSTCAVAGVEYDLCLTCSEMFNYAIIPLAEHTWSDWATETSADCVTEGLEKRTCSVCAKVEENVLPALGHDFSEEWIIDIQVTCETDGSESHHCSRCDEKSDVTVIPAPGHTWGSSITVATATCTQTGLEKRTCSVCEKVEESVLPALGHDFSAEWTVDKQATCEAAGSKSHHCSRCDEKSEVTAIPAIGHSWGSWVKTKEPTFINFGELTRICANCGRKETQNTEKLVPKEEIVNKETGVSVSVLDDTYEGEVVVDVSPVYDGASFQLINTQIGNFNASVYDITTTVNGNAVQPSGMVLIKMPIPAGYNPATLVVYYLPNDGSAPEKMNCYVEGNYVCFETNHFSEYAIVDEGKEVVVPQYIMGDANGDGKITAADARLVLRVSAKLETLSETAFLASDVNKDKKITAADARTILRVSAKLESF